MKKITFALLLFILIPTITLAWDDCLHNKIDSLYPGDCAKYIDTDNDEICDHSQLAPEDRIFKIANAAQITKEISISDTKDKQQKSIYHLLPISLFLIVLYTFSHILSKKKIISVVNHRKIWNFLLLITFLISGILGILLVIEINFGISIISWFNILFWHVEVGIAMFAISIFHIIWHWPYFKNMFKIKPGSK
jgi:hypothetical protein